MSSQQKDKHIIILIDNSYSMMDYCDKISTGINSFIEKLYLQNTPDKNIYITICFFSSILTYNIKKYNINNIIPVDIFKCGVYSTTSLYDSIAEIFREFLEDNCDTSFYIISDGDDNTSRKYNKEKVQELCEFFKTDKKWNIVHCTTDNLNLIEYQIGFDINDVDNMLENLATLTI